MSAFWFLSGLGVLFFLGLSGCGLAFALSEAKIEVVLHRRAALSEGDE